MPLGQRAHDLWVVHYKGWVDTLHLDEFTHQLREEEGEGGGGGGVRGRERGEIEKGEKGKRWLR